MEKGRQIRVGVRELRGNLTHYLSEVGAGNRVIITARGIVVAELRAPSVDVLPPRRPGSLKGRIHMAEDFDTLPDDIAEATEAWNS